MYQILDPTCSPQYVDQIIDYALNFQHKIPKYTSPEENKKGWNSNTLGDFEIYHNNFDRVYYIECARDETLRSWRCEIIARIQYEGQPLYIQLLVHTITSLYYTPEIRVSGLFYLSQFPNLFSNVILNRAKHPVDLIHRYIMTEQDSNVENRGDDVLINGGFGPLSSPLPPTLKCLCLDTICRRRALVKLGFKRKQLPKLLKRSVKDYIRINRTKAHHRKLLARFERRNLHRFCSPR